MVVGLVEAPMGPSSVWEMVQKWLDGGGLLGTWLFASIEKESTRKLLFKGGNTT
jgi:hypothetical protein